MFYHNEESDIKDNQVSSSNSVIKVEKKGRRGSLNEIDVNSKSHYVSNPQTHRDTNAKGSISSLEK